MSKVVTPIAARVEVIGKPKESSFNPGTYYYSTLFIDLSQPEGSESAKIWKSLSGDEVSQILKGDLVQLVPAGHDKNGKPKHNIVVTQPRPAVPQPQGDKSEPIADKGLGQLSPDTKWAIAAYVDSQSDLYRFCYQTAQGKLDGMTNDLETTRCMATTLYLGAVRKFGLDR
jgi:hypothetical protein